MPLFHIHLRTAGGLDEDDTGLDFPSLEHAYLEAYGSIPEMTAEFVSKGVNPQAFAFVIADAAGEVLTEVPFSEILRDRQPSRPPGRPGRSRRLSEEIAAEIASARETLRLSREIVGRARAQRP